MHADGETVFDDPLGELAHGECRHAVDFGAGRLLEDGAHEDGVAARGQVVVLDQASGPVVVFAVADDELDFVVRAEAVDVVGVVAVGLARGGGFYVHDADDAGVGASVVVEVDGAAGLDEDGFPRVAETGDEVVDALLEEWFAAGDLDEVASVGEGLVEDVVDLARGALAEGVFGVAVGAAEVAAGESDEDAGSTGVGGLALDGVEDLVDAEGGHRR